MTPMTPVPENPDGKMPKRLSSTSKMYDIDGNGILDSAEQKLRDLDVENKGQLSNDQVYAIVQEQIEAERKLYKAKRALYGIILFAVILALTTLGTAFAAAHLAKESTVVERSGNVVNEEELMSKDGHVAIGVHTIGHEIWLDQHDHGGGIADHACVKATKVLDVWEDIASEFEVHLVLKKYGEIDTADHKLEAMDLAREKMLNEELIPLTGAKSSGDEVCFTSFNEVAACVSFSDVSCADELDEEEMLAMTFPNTKFL